MIVTWAAGALLAYVYVGYPLLLRVAARGATQRRPPLPGRWPSISITLPVHNGAAELAGVLEAILAAEYPGERQVLVVSDGSDDPTPAIASAFSARGVELLHLPERVGKTEAENLAAPRLRGEVVVNTDASVRLHPRALIALVSALQDPNVGVASGRDVSVVGGDGTNAAETAYVDYEMRLRALETAAGGIVGASGCLYAIRADLHRRVLPPHLSRDFAAALHARRHGFGAVSVPGAICFVPRGQGRMHEYRRKVRTMARGLATLWWERELLDPSRYGRFAWMLLSHKLLRWLTPVALVAVAIAWVAPGSGNGMTRAAALLGIATAALGWWWPGEGGPRFLRVPAYGVGAVLAALHAWARALTGGVHAVWEPTRRGVTTRPDGPA